MKRKKFFLLLPCIFLSTSLHTMEKNTESFFSKEERIEKARQLKELIENVRADTTIFDWEIKETQQEIIHRQKNLEQLIGARRPNWRHIEKTQKMIKKIKNRKKVLEIMEIIKTYAQEKNPGPPPEPLKTVLSAPQVMQEVEENKKIFNDFIEQQRKTYWPE